MNKSSYTPQATAKILVVEDSATQAQRLRHILEKHGYEVSVATNGRLAMEMLPRVLPALVISDINMPEMDGYELCACVKARANFSETPVILVTSLSDPQDVIRGLECGADIFVLKPFDEQYLLGRVRYVLLNREMRRPHDVGIGVEVHFNGRRHFITADRLQILNLLLSTYDAAIQRNRELDLIKKSLEKRSAEIDLANHFLDSVIEGIPDMIFVKDAAELRFVRINRAGEELLGMRRQELIGLGDHDMFPKEEADFFRAKDLEVMAGNDVGYYEEPIHTRHNGTRLLQTKKFTVRDDSGQPRYLLGIARDVTDTRALQDELHRRNEELLRSQTELEETNRRLNELTAELEERVRERTRELTDVVDALEESEARVRLTIENALDAVVILDSGGIVIEWNEQARVIFGWTRAEAVGKPLVDMCVPARYRDSHAAGIDRAVLKGTSVMLDRRIEIEAIDRNGREFPVELAISAIKIKGQWCFSAFLRDITARREVEQRTLHLNRELELRVGERTSELVAARENADAANRAKSSFLATMSHEIRTPLNGMLGMLELLSLSGLNAEQAEALSMARESSRSLMHIIDDVLDFSMIEAGKLKIRPEQSSIERVVTAVQHTHLGNAARKGVPIEAFVDRNIEPALWVDPGRLTQILNNFVSNAVKFTDHGSVQLRAELLDQDETHQRLRFLVIDSGIGISPEDQKKLFQPFSQVEAAARHIGGGTGLGLTICRRLADMMGATVEMQSEPGRGTTMVMEVKLPLAAQLDADPGSTLLAPDVFAPARVPLQVCGGAARSTSWILLVDDHPLNRILLTRQVQTLGYEAVSVEDGAQALERWRHGGFGLVITDCQLPVMDGYEFVRKLRDIEARESRPRVPVIACTANALGGEAARCFEVGMDDFLLKPVDLAHLYEKLRKWLPRHGGAGEPALPGAGLTAHAPRGRFDTAVIAASWGGGPRVLREVLDNFRRATDEDAAVLRQAFDAGDLPAATRCAHRMLGAGKMVGAAAFVDACEQVQHAAQTSHQERLALAMEIFDEEWAGLRASIEQNALQRDADRLAGSPPLDSMKR